MEREKYRISVDDLNNSDFEAICACVEIYSSHEMELHFSSLAQKYKESGDISSWKLCFLLKIIFGFHFSRSGDVIGYEPKMVLYPERSRRPSDCDSEFNEILTEIKKKTDNPFILARVCDVLWMNDRKNIDAGKLSVSSYDQIINKLCDALSLGKNSIESKLFFALDLLERGLSLASMLSGRKKKFDDPILQSALKLYDVYLDCFIFNGFLRLSICLYKYNAVDIHLLASNAEIIADKHYEMKISDAVQKLFLFAADLYQRVNLNSEQQRCQIKAAELTLIQYEKAESAMHRVHWLRCALGEYRNIVGQSEKMAWIRSRLDVERELINDEMHIFSTPLELKEIIDETNSAYLDLSLPDTFRLLISRFKIPSIEVLEEQAINDAQNFAFLSMVGTSVIDDSGRLVAQRKPLSTSETMTYEQICDNYLRTFYIAHQIYVGGEFEVVRMNVLNNFTLNENTFDAITFQSPFVPPEHASIFSLGFYRLWQGDYMSACYLLIPQVENSIRWVLKSFNKETTKIDTKLFEEATSLSQMLTNHKKSMEDIFGPKIVLSLDLLFNFKGGPALRHEMAHGRLSNNICFSSTAVFACCFTFYLVCLPLYKNWDEVIEPHLN